MSTAEFLFTPSEFYQTLISSFRTSRSRISIATLYIGNSPMERSLLEAIPRDRAVNILLDGLRGNRKEKNGVSSVYMINKYCPQANVREYISPRFSTMCSLLPNRVNEIVGTQHMKLIVVDDDVIVTGANLSDIYFTNRQDRYLVLRGVSELARQLGLLIGGGGNQTGNENSFTEYNHISDPFSISSSILQFSTQFMSPDSTTLETLQEAVNTNSNIVLCSPYLNLSPDIVDVLNQASSVSIITGSKESNAFHNSKGFSRHIPAAYESMQFDLSEKLKNANFFNFHRPGWTFHPKGIWVIDPKTNIPHTTIIGSSNFGVRSRQRDLEISFRFATSSRSLQQQMKQELDGIQKFVAPVTFARNKNPMWIKYLSRNFLKSFL